MKTINARINRIKAKACPEPAREWITLYEMDGHYYLNNPIRPLRDGDPDIELTRAQVDEYERTHEVIMVSYVNWTDSHVAQVRGM